MSFSQDIKQLAIGLNLSPDDGADLTHAETHALASYLSYKHGISLDVAYMGLTSTPGLIEHLIEKTESTLEDAIPAEWEESEPEVVEALPQVVIVPEPAPAPAPKTTLKMSASKTVAPVVDSSVDRFLGDE